MCVKMSLFPSSEGVLPHSSNQLILHSVRPVNQLRVPNSPEQLSSHLGAPATIASRVRHVRTVVVLVEAPCRQDHSGVLCDSADSNCQSWQIREKEGRGMEGHFFLQLGIEARKDGGLGGALTTKRELPLGVRDDQDQQDLVVLALKQAMRLGVEVHSGGGEVLVLKDLHDLRLFGAGEDGVFVLGILLRGRASAVINEEGSMRTCVEEGPVHAVQALHEHPERLWLGSEPDYPGLGHLGLVSHLVVLVSRLVLLSHGFRG